MRVKVKTLIIIEGGPRDEPSMMEFTYEHHYGDNPRFWAHAVQCAVGSAAQSVSVSLDPKVDLQIGKEPSGNPF